jgi:hypothetical protein
MIEWIQLFFLQSVKKQHSFRAARGLTRENDRYRDEINSTFHVAEVLLLGRATNRIHDFDQTSARRALPFSRRQGHFSVQTKPIQP